MHLCGCVDKVSHNGVTHGLYRRVDMQGKSIGCMVSPVNFRVKFVEPGKAEDEAICAEVCDVESLNSYVHTSCDF